MVYDRQICTVFIKYRRDRKDEIENWYLELASLKKNEIDKFSWLRFTGQV